MTTTYKLISFSRNVELPIFPDGKHSGYALVRYEDNVAVAMKTIEVSAVGAFGYMDFISSDDSASGYADGWIPVDSNLSSGNMIVPEKVYEDGQWITPTNEWLTNREYKTVELKDNGQDLTNPEDLYEQIETNAKLLDQFKITYDPLMMNCNTWTAYIDNTILNDVGVIEQLNSIGEANTYIGSEMPFPAPGLDAYFSPTTSSGWFNYERDKAVINNVEQVQTMLKDKGLNYNDVFMTFKCSLASISCAVNNGGEITNIVTEYRGIQQDTGNIITDISASFSTAKSQASPLVVDLDGDGIETLGTDAGVYFDHANDGFAENTGWVDKDDGLLVRDINNNGKIDDGTELFGNNSVLSSENKATNGFDALADLDTNNFLRPIVKSTPRWFELSILTIIKNLSASERFFIMVGPDGLEPTTRPL